MNERKKIGKGLVGPGFIAPHHIDAVRRLGNVEVVASRGRATNPPKQRLLNSALRKPIATISIFLTTPPSKSFTIPPLAICTFL
jgi:hypothetical protein